MYIIVHVGMQAQELIGAIMAAALPVFQTGMSAFESMSMSISSSS